jgi:hypothetical protein
MWLDVLTHGRMLLLLRKHVCLLRLQMRQCVCIGPSHAWLHAHHGTWLAHRTIGARYTWMHARGHLLAGVWSWAAYGMAMLHALRMHAGVVRVGRGHHLRCCST